MAVYPFPTANLSLSQVLRNYNIQEGLSLTNMDSLRGKNYWDTSGLTTYTIPVSGIFPLSILFGKYTLNPSSVTFSYTSGPITFPANKPPPKSFDIQLIGGGGGGGGGAGGYNCALDIRTGGGGGGGSSGVIFTANSINYIGNLFGIPIYGSGGSGGGAGGSVGCTNPLGQSTSGGPGGLGTDGGTTTLSYNGVIYSGAGGKCPTASSGGGGYNAALITSYEGSRGSDGQSAGPGSVPGVPATGFVQTPGTGGLSPLPFSPYGSGGNGGGGSISSASSGTNGTAGVIRIIWYYI